MPRFARRRGRYQFRAPRNVVQSFKKQINHASLSVPAATLTSDLIAVGVDSIAAGQTGPTDVNVPTGSVISKFTLQSTWANLVSVNCVVHYTIQIIRGSQVAFVHPQLVGGDNQRNQVFFSMMRNIGADQNFNINMNFKIPKKFQRIREGDQWTIFWIANSVTQRTAQYIYTFFR